ncbi:hypothetical protein MMC31_005266 [Peltigera leucophlebia]|nr:hypothetical protein [Peltigera leucophlebia]
MDSELRVRPCARPACDARRNQSCIDSCCDETCLEAIGQVLITQTPDKSSDDAQSTPPAGLQQSLAQWKAALDRAECLCTEMFKLGLPSCCVTKTSKVSPMKDKAQSCPKQCCSIMSLKSTKNVVVKDPTGEQRPCPSTKSSLKACYSSLPTAGTPYSLTPPPMACCSSSPSAKSTQSDIIPASGMKACCSPLPGVNSTQCGSSAPSSETYCISAPSTKIAQLQAAERGSPPKEIQLFSDQQGLLGAATDLEEGSAAEHAVTLISGMTCAGCEQKLQRVLSGIPGVRHVKTSLVLGRAEFDVDVGLSIDDVASLVERQTEFRCTIYRKGHQLNVLVPGHFSSHRLGFLGIASENELAPLLPSLAGPNYPAGVEDVKIIDSNGREWNSGTANGGFQRLLELKIFARKAHMYSARISYNPRVVGARDLLESGFGAPLFLAPISSDYAIANETDHFRNTLYMSLFSALLTIPVLIMAWAPLPHHTMVYESSSLALATMVQFIIAGPFYPKALKALLFSGMIEMDLLIVVSTTTAYVYSVVAFLYQINGQPLCTGGFFETSTLLVTLIMFGRLASAYARREAANSISVQALQPLTALLSDDGNERLIDVREFQYGDLFKVLPDSIIPTDGIIVSGETEIDESMVTGEVIPSPKFPGSQIMAGTINGSAPVLARLTQLPINNTISRIASMVDEAKLSKPRVQKTADRVASYFVPCIFAVAFVVFSIWIAIGIVVRDLSTADAIVTAFTYALAALIVSCPCAIGLAVPMVMVIASGVGAKYGVIFKSIGAIENARNATHVVFDKTGTLTQGKFVVVEEVYRGENRNQTASIVKQLTSSSNHPVSQALATHLEPHGNGSIKLANISSVVGRGMHATLVGRSVRGGNPLYIGAVEDLDVQRLLSQGLTVFCLRYGSDLLAVFGLRDALRIDAASVISTLQARNIPVSIVSGDSITAVNKLATELGIPLSQAKSQCTPGDKARYIDSLSAVTPRSRRNISGTIIFCGDGSNDAVALAQADIGIHMAGGTDVAKSAADVVLTHQSISGVLALIDLSRASMRRVHINFAWSFIYNLFAILLAGGAFLTVRIPPAYAGLGELVSVLPVIAVAMHLQWMKFR